MLEHLKELNNLIVLNDEAHHFHDTDLAWSQSLRSIHQTLPRGLALWLDFSATPKDQHGMYFLKMEFATTETEVHQADLAAGVVPISEDLLRSITHKVLQRAKLPTAFAKLYPLVRTYVSTRCFGQTVDVDSETVRSHLQRLELQASIARYLARQIATLTVDKRPIEFERADFTLSSTRPFAWRRNLPPLVAQRTVFNYVTTYNNFERRFAQFLDVAPDVLRFASLGTTEQGESGTLFRVDYLKPSGAIGFYYPDWVVVQSTEQGEVNWIIETKGRLWEDTAAKDAAMRDWCARLSQHTGQRWEYARVDQSTFEVHRPAALAEATQRDQAKQQVLGRGI